MAASIIKLQTNIPISGTLKAAYYATSTQGYGDQIKVMGNWDGGIGQAAIYVPGSWGGRLQELGLVVPTGAQDKDGHPAYNTSPTHFSMSKGEKGAFRIELSNGQAPPTQAAQPPAPQQATQQPRQQAQPTQTAQESPAVRVARLNATMASCIKAANLAWKQALGDGDGQVVPYELVAATAHTLFIARQRDGLLSPAPKVEQAVPAGATADQHKAMGELAAQIGLDVGAMLAARFKKTVDKLTEAEATQAITMIRTEIDDRARLRREQEAAQETAQADMGGDAYEGDDPTDF